MAAHTRRLTLCAGIIILARTNALVDSKDCLQIGEEVCDRATASFGIPSRPGFVKVDGVFVLATTETCYAAVSQAWEHLISGTRAWGDLLLVVNVIATTAVLCMGYRATFAVSCEDQYGITRLSAVKSLRNPSQPSGVTEACLVLGVIFLFPAGVVHLVRHAPCSRACCLPCRSTVSAEFACCVFFSRARAAGHASGQVGETRQGMRGQRRFSNDSEPDFCGRSVAVRAVLRVCPRLRLVSQAQQASTPEICAEKQAWTQCSTALALRGAGMHHPSCNARYRVHTKMDQLSSHLRLLSTDHRPSELYSFDFAPVPTAVAAEPLSLGSLRTSFALGWLRRAALACSSSGGTSGRCGWMSLRRASVSLASSPSLGKYS